MTFGALTGAKQREAFIGLRICLDIESISGGSLAEIMEEARFRDELALESMCLRKLVVR